MNEAEIRSRWLMPIDALTSQFDTAFSALSEEELNWKPHPGAWSVGQVIDHLIVINGTFFRLLSEFREGKVQLPWLARFDFPVRLIGDFILKGTRHTNRRKVKTFPVWEPSHSTFTTDKLQQFTRQQEDLKLLIISTADLLARRTVIPSPANRNIVYFLPTAYDIIVEHERRHYFQAIEAMELARTKQKNTL